MPESIIVAITHHERCKLRGQMSEKYKIAITTLIQYADSDSLTICRSICRTQDSNVSHSAVCTYTHMSVKRHMMYVTSRKAICHFYRRPVRTSASLPLKVLYL
jgi:hypothetical protein